MCPTLLGQAHERNGIFVEFGIEFDKKFDNGFDKPIWEKMPACGYSRPQEVLCVSFILVRLALVIHKSLVWSERLFEDHFFNFFIK